MGWLRFLQAGRKFDCLRSPSTVSINGLPSSCILLSRWKSLIHAHRYLTENHQKLCRSILFLCMSKKLKVCDCSWRLPIIWKCLFLDFIQNLRSCADFSTVLLPKPSFFSAYWTRENLCGMAGFESDTFLGHIWNKSPYFKLDLWFLFINVVFFIWLPIESILMG